MQSSSASSVPSPYQVGGSLAPFASTYVQRQADYELAEALQQRQFCYVLNSRQMGKSSLLVQLLQRIRSWGDRGTIVDLTTIGSGQVSEAQWYRGLLVDLLRGFDLLGQVDYRTWWDAQGDLSWVQKLQHSIRELLLPQFPTEHLVICIDEIDSILSLPFAVDDFFAFIRYCYNQRAIDPEWRRVTFVICGVATPTDLIRDSLRTPFNIGQAIALQGFQFEDCEPLITNLAQVITPAPAVFREILHWTGGQPFLTQKVCALIWHQAQIQANRQLALRPGTEAEWVAQLVRDRIIANWESQDEPEHLRTIRDRLLRNPNQVGRLLGLVQQITQNGSIRVDPAEDTVDLLLSGLVNRDQDTLRFKNLIYQYVFDANWVAQKLQALRPYSQMLDPWIASDQQDMSRLLRGEALQDAQRWARGKQLSPDDYQFLTQSAIYDYQETQRAIELERAAALASQLAQERRQNQLQRYLLMAVSGGLLLSATLGVLALRESRRANFNAQQAKQSEVQALVASAQGWFNSNQRLAAMLQVVQAQNQLAPLTEVTPELTATVTTTLDRVILGTAAFNRLEGHTGEVQDVAYSPAGDQLASTSEDGTVKLWRPNGQLLFTLPGDAGRRGTTVQYSPAGDRLAASTKSGAMAIWNAQTGDRVLTLRHPIDISPLLSAAFSPDGRRVAVGALGGNIYVWRLDTGRLIQTFTGHQAMVRSLSFSPDGQTLVSGSADQTVILWDVATGERRQTLTGHAATVADVRFSPDGQTLASASSDNTVKLWNADGTLRHTLQGHQAAVTTVRFSPDSQMVVSASLDHEARFWHISGESIRGYENITVAGSSLDLSPDGQTLIAPERLNNHAVMMWRLQSPFYQIVGRHPAAVLAIAAHPTDQTLISGDGMGMIRRWDPVGQLRQTLSGHQATVLRLEVSADGRTLVSSSMDGTVRIWPGLESDSAAEPAIVVPVHGGVGAIALHPQQPYIAIGTFSGQWQVIDRQGRVIQRFKTEMGGIASLAWTAAGHLVVGGRDGSIEIRDGQTGRLYRKLWGHQGSVQSVAMLPDRRQFVSASADRQLHIWEIATGRRLATLTGHQDTVNEVRVIPATRDRPALIASVSKDKTVRLWSLEGEAIATFDRHTAEILGLTVSPDGQTIYSSGSDETVIQWNLEPLLAVDPLDYACTWLQDYLTHSASVESRDRLICPDQPPPSPPSASNSSPSQRAATRPE